jgi:cyanate permease
MKFGKKLLDQQYGPWVSYYLNYEQLKDVLEKSSRDDSLYSHHAESDSHADYSLTSSLPFTSSMKHHPVTAEFLSVFHVQLEKMLLFVVQEQGRIATELLTCRHRAHTATTEDEFNEIYAGYQQAGEKILRLVQFLDLNVTGIRKILKKHDKCMSVKLSKAFFLNRSGGVRLRGSRLVEPLLVQDHTLGALTTILEGGFLELAWNRQQTADMLLMSVPQTVRKVPQHQRLSSDPTLLANIASDSHSIPRPPTKKAPRLSWTPACSSKLPDSHGTALSSSSIGAMQRTFLWDPSHVRKRTSNELILLRIQAARNRLEESSSFVGMLANTLLMDGYPQVLEQEEEDEDLTATPVSDFLNLLSTFLHMTNYYIVAPTSGSYARKLGGDPSMASLIIGMTPVAALVSTILFSWWTNHSYKHALIFASSCSFVGNIFYAAGLPCDSIHIVMIGRLMNGFGSARSINRRYIADRFSRKERTAASAAFVTAGALGMAAGPLIASILNAVSPDDSDSRFWQVENAPGWVMMIVWGVYLIALIVWFRDPSKRSISTTKKDVGTNNEEAPLIQSRDQSKGVASNFEDEAPIWNNIPVMTTFLIYFVLKLVLEAVLSSSATLTEYYFDWNSSISGVYLASLGLSMLPANLVVSLLARRYDDRELIILMQLCMFLGCVGVIKYSAQYTVLQYVVGTFVMFVSSNALEGPNMSLLSKTIPKRWSQGIFNVGLLATEAGTAGRAVGDVLLSLFGKEGVEHLLNRTFVCFAVTSGATLLLSVRLYDDLEPSDKDD